MNLTPKVDCKYGAPMGRQEWNDNPTMGYCPSCERNVETVGYDGVPDQSLRACPECGTCTELSRPYTGKMYLQRIRLNSGGYDAGGAYWGIGARLYGFAAADDSINGFVRACDRADAIERVRTKYPGVSFFGERRTS